MKKTNGNWIAVFLFIASSGMGQTTYTLTSNTKGNQIELTVANQSAAQAASQVEVKAVKHPAFIRFTSGAQGISSIAPNAAVAATFTFDVGLARTVSGKDTLEFLITDNAGSSWTKQIIVSYAAPEVFSLDQNYPNPFNPTTTIKYQLPVESKVSLKVYDLLGREVVGLVNEQQAAGYREARFDAANLASGVYFYRIIAQPLDGGSMFSQLKKLMVLK